ncbi:undecaprenyldiphospho-muramoylpentapeptide beta-N-acetylglucosaminyltransferase [Lactococcus termiticola]|uniref:UDP-N-acetylglucosamine--N-acetylmuramyl-(pentapeptide) pyrophosphoryl-undecaprenol N-acetylglucosamine transferase n=1 Tax=Lactococcus termiticola TaxID=2169526 RepID=A0A2R5HF18_9LACT|nr:undecaprenyldiphospho-muramoylpentapeptide beta-N-acetylglucosaminyltransferase [Lactococcus termiticola]GBG96649.1 UDP-N-acetylglucosamine--N-acetylmuramyl-(pentapeptide) pyrophosphoryl-undecaprenol N-acetylglucosamine transferase [Lactococcus termiticola]
MKLLVTGGGTGGHIYPALAFINYLKTQDENLEVLYVGTQKGLESKIVPQAGLAFKTVDIQGFRRSLSLENFRTVAKFLKSVGQAKKIIKDFAPDAVLGTGGYVAGPVVYAAAQLKIPTLIHEGNSYPGVTNRFLAKRVTKIAVGFHAAESYFPAEKTSFTGNPRAQEIADSAKVNQKFDQPTVVIFGGSRGALTLNEAFVSALPKLAEAPFKTIYASGEIYYEDYKETFEQYRDKENIEIQPYINNMIDLLSKSHLFLGRSGSTTIAEVTALGLPAIYVPSPNVTADQQTKNAQEYVDQGAAVIVKDAELTADKLVQAISEILENKVKYEEMHKASLLAGVPDASERLYQLLKEMVQ